nr:MAG TPA: hypothetical protein [Caudoviricetes sp.]
MSYLSFLILISLTLLEKIRVGRKRKTDFGR